MPTSPNWIKRPWYWKLERTLWCQNKFGNQTSHRRRIHIYSIGSIRSPFFSRWFDSSCDWGRLILTIKLYLNIWGQPGERPSTQNYISDFRFEGLKLRHKVKSIKSYSSYYIGKGVYLIKHIIRVFGCIVYFQISHKSIIDFYQTRVRSLHCLPLSLTGWLTGFSRLGWCDSGLWRFVETQ